MSEFLRAYTCFRILFFSFNSLVYAQPADLTKELSAIKEAGSPDLVARLNQSLANYTANPDPVTWNSFWLDFTESIKTLAGNHSALMTVLNGVTGLSNLGFKLMDAPTVKVFSFSQVPESQQILVEWKEASLVKPVSLRKAKVVRPVLSTVTKWQTLSCPGYIQVSDGRIIAGGAAAVKGAKPCAAGRFLILCGADKKSGDSWLKGFRLVNANWSPAPELFSGVPPYLLQNIQGKPSFSGSNLVFTSNSSNGSDSEGYKLVLHFLLITMPLIAKQLMMLP